MLNIDHPDIEDFDHAKDGGRLDQFQYFRSRQRTFHESCRVRLQWQLVHKAEPSDELLRDGCFLRYDGVSLCIYSCQPKIFGIKSWNLLTTMLSSIIFIDVNLDNNLSYCEQIEATNPCAKNHCHLMDVAALALLI